MNTVINSMIPLPDTTEMLIPAHQLPHYVGIAQQTLARWRHEGKGPRYVKAGRRIFYRTGDVRSWIDDQTRQSTAA